MNRTNSFIFPFKTTDFTDINSQHDRIATILVYVGSHIITKLKILFKNFLYNLR